jgi:hypothetical protein
MKKKTKKAILNIDNETFNYWNKYWKLKDQKKTLNVEKEFSYNGENHYLVSEIDNPKNKRNIPSIFLQDIKIA